MALWQYVNLTGRLKQHCFSFIEDTHRKL